MSILLSAYFPEGIVFAADKNVTLLYESADGVAQQDVEEGATVKVVPWACRRAVVGYCGLGQLACLPLAEWMRQFAAKTRDFDDLTELASQMRDAIQHDFDRDYPKDVSIDQAGLIVHLGGFRYENGIAVPAMYYISNVPGFDECGRYSNPTRQFSEPSDELRTKVVNVGSEQFRQWVEDFYSEGKLLWFNNGLYFPAFNVFKESLWQALTALRSIPCNFLPDAPTLDDRLAYCKMAVELFGSFFRHHFLPSYRSVGGGVDAEWVAWPEKEPGYGLRELVCRVQSANHRCPRPRYRAPNSRLLSLL